MRIDKLLSNMGLASRSESAKSAKLGEIKVNGITVKKADAKIDPCKDVVEFRGKIVEYTEKVYIMLNKPQGYVSSTDSKDGKTVLELLPEDLQKRGLFPCGRLDKDTLGLMILTNDGETAHYLLSPKRHVSKIYNVKTKLPFSENDKQALEKGVRLDGGDVTRPAKVDILSSNEVNITIVEGMYHQIKRMLEAVGNEVTLLERIEFGTLPLDTNLKRGEWRFLTEKEIKILLDQTI